MKEATATNIDEKPATAMADVVHIKGLTYSHVDPEKKTVTLTVNQFKALNKSSRDGVVFGRKLSKAQQHIHNARHYVSNQIQFLVTKQGVSPQSHGIMLLRNSVRLMKGKNVWR